MVGPRDDNRPRLRACGGPGRPRPHCCTRAKSACGLSVAISRCSGAMRSIRAAASSSSCHHDNRAVIAPACAGDFAARQQRQAGVRLRRATASANAASSVMRMDCERRIVLGLREKIGRDPGGIVGAVGHHQNLPKAPRWNRCRPPEHFALGRRHIGVARPHDLVDGRDRRRAIGQRRHRLRAADAIDLRHARDLRRHQRQRIDRAARSPASP